MGGEAWDWDCEAAMTFSSGKVSGVVACQQDGLAASGSSCFLLRRDAIASPVGATAGGRSLHSSLPRCCPKRWRIE